MIKMLCPTATAARFLPVRGSKRRNWAPKAELGAQVGRLGPSRRVGRLDEGGAQPRTARACASAAAFGCAAVGKRVISTPLWSDKHFGGASAPPANGIQQHHRLLNRAHPLRDLRTHPLNDLVKEIAVRQLLSHEEALLRLELAGERLLKLRDLLAQAPARQLSQRQLSQRRRIGSAGASATPPTNASDQRRKDVAP